MAKKPSFSTKKFVALFDIHCGFERKRLNKRKTVTVPTHNTPAIAAAMEFIKDFKPDEVVLAGDQLNFAPVSHWNKSNFWSNEGGRIKQEMDILEELVISPVENLSLLAEKTWMDGNHEVWLDQFIEANPAVEGLVEPVNYLGLQDRGWKMLEQGAMHNIGKIGIVHGDLLRGPNPAQKAAYKYCRNVRSGHHHTYAAYTMYNPVDNMDIKTSISVPCLAARNPGYGKNDPNSHLNGFLYGYVWPNGNFTDYVVIMENSRFVTPDGKVYDGKQLVKGGKK